MQQAIFFTLFVSLTAIITVIHSQTPTPTSCSDLTRSCAQCNSSPLNCRYVWTQPGCYNSSINATCLPQAEVDQLLWYNEYNMTVYAYALKEDEVTTTEGQYLLSNRKSSISEGAYVVLCYDRNLCYCKQPPPPPPNTVIVVVTDCQTGLPLLGANVNLTSTNLTSPVLKTSNITGQASFYPLPSSTYFVNVYATGFLPNSSDVGVLVSNATAYVQLCLVEQPCTVTVVTYDSSTNLTLSAAFVSLNSASFAPQITGTDGRTQFTINAALASLATGSKQGYTSAVGSFVCSLGGSVTVNLYLTPLPNTVYVQVLDQSTLQPITSASVVLTSSSSSSSVNARNSGVNGTAVATFATVAPGTYGASASAAGYASNSTSVGTLTYNQTAFVVIYLAQLPCVVVITSYDSSTNATLPSTTISFNGVSTNSTTDGNGGLTTTYTVAASAPTGFTASKVGYSSVTTTFRCGSNSTLNVNVYLTPLPNTIIVQVLDSHSFLPVNTASVTGQNVQGTLSSTESVAPPNATVTFTDVPPGTYSANASAPGYFPNSTTVGTLVRAETLVAIIYLQQQPCNLVVYVRTLGTNTSIPGANVELNEGGYAPVLTDSTGVSRFTLQSYNLADSVNATASGYGNGSADFQCTPGANLTVFVYLNQILQILIAATDAFNNNDLLPSATILLSSGSSTVQLTQTYKPNPSFYVAQVTSLPITYSVTASTGGYETQTQSITWTSSGQMQTIALIPVEFSVYFTPTELFSNGTTQFYNSSGLFVSGFVPNAGYFYLPSSGTFGGSADKYQNGSVDTLSAYVANQLVNNATYFAAPFLQQVPTSESPFYLRITNLATLAANFNSSVGPALLIFIPDFTATDVRTLLFPLPYKRSAGFLIITAVALSPTGASTNFKTFFAVRLTAGSTFFQTAPPTGGDLTGPGVSIEFLLDFGVTVTAITPQYDTNQINATSSAFVNAPALPFAWPPQSFTSQLFTTLPNGQQARLPNSVLWYQLIYNAVLTTQGKKK